MIPKIRNLPSFVDNQLGSRIKWVKPGKYFLMRITCVMESTVDFRNCLIHKVVPIYQLGHRCKLIPIVLTMTFQHSEKLPGPSFCITK